jgi:comEA protein
MNRWFTPQERGVILFLVAALLVGSVVYLHKARTPYFAPELKILEDGKWTTLDEHEQKTTLPELIEKTRTALKGTDQSDEQVNINTSTAHELTGLPGIGPALAKRIVEYRERSGGFKKPEHITRVSGIGPKKFEKLKDRIVVE